MNKEQGIEKEERMFNGQCSMLKVQGRELHAVGCTQGRQGAIDRKKIINEQCSTFNDQWRKRQLFMITY
jgi:hypothetical protein